MKTIWLILGVIFLDLSSVITYFEYIEAIDLPFLLTAGIDIAGVVFLIINIAYPITVRKCICRTDSGKILDAVLWAKIGFVPDYIFLALLIAEYSGTERILPVLLLGTLIERLSTSVYAIVRIAGLYRKGVISKKELFVHIVLQLVIAADIVSVILLKKREAEEGAMRGVDVKSIPIPKHRNGVCILLTALFPAVIYLGGSISFEFFAKPAAFWAFTILGLIADVAMAVAIIVFSVKMQFKIDLTKNKWTFITAILAKILLIPFYMTVCLIIAAIMGIFANPWLMIIDVILLPVAIPFIIILIFIMSGLVSIPAMSRVICYARKKKLSVGMCVFQCFLLITPVIGVIDCIIMCFAEGKINKQVDRENEGAAAAISVQ